MSNQTRRTFLKSIAYGSALSMGGLSSLAMANANKLTVETIAKGSALPTCDIQLLPKQHIGSEILSLINHTDTHVSVGRIMPVGLKNTNKYLSIKVDKLGKHAHLGTVTLAPKEELRFVVSAISSDKQGNTTHNSSVAIPNVLAGKLKVNSDHYAFNGIIPVTVFDAQAV